MKQYSQHDIIKWYYLIKTSNRGSLSAREEVKPELASSRLSRCANVYQPRDSLISARGRSEYRIRSYAIHSWQLPIFKTRIACSPVNKPLDADAAARHRPVDFPCCGLWLGLRQGWPELRQILQLFKFCKNCNLLVRACSLNKVPHAWSQAPFC